jgi:hypothetical protein
MSAPFRDAWIGVVFSHLLLDAHTIMEVPILDYRSRQFTIFGGEFRTASTAGKSIMRTDLG